MSNLDIFKIGIGPSSSHTLGPLIAGNMFCEFIKNDLENISRVKITLYGSLSFTGKGHLSDCAIIWGLNKISPKEINVSLQEEILDLAVNHNSLNLAGKRKIKFDHTSDIIFSKEFLSRHENALKIEALDKDGKNIKSNIYYSTGGGYVVSEISEKDEEKKSNFSNLDTYFTINNTKDILQICETKNISLSELSMNYELQFNSKEFIEKYCLEIWEIMQEVFANGINPKNDYLPGKLHLKRRASGLYKRLYVSDDPMAIIDYISLYAIAIAEENANGSKVVTAPTNGACAVIPAVMLYLKNHTKNFNETKVINFILTSMLIGSLYKKNASISGAEAGCQAEIGSASSMAAAAMVDAYGGSAVLACNAAEIAMEHHLGLTCDPVYGLVQIPCIERNAFGAIKAISAARMALARKSTPRVSLDAVIKTMYETGKDMNHKYKETSLGGLAINSCN